MLVPVAALQFTDNFSRVDVGNEEVDFKEILLRQEGYVLTVRADDRRDVHISRIYFLGEDFPTCFFWIIAFFGQRQIGLFDSGAPLV